MRKIVILGGGSWATAFAHLISEKNDVLMYVRNEENSKSINEKHTNSKYLREVTLKDNVKASSSLSACLKDADLVINAIPTQNTRSVFLQAKEYMPKDAVILNLSKGIELKSFERISEITKAIFPDNIFAVLSGPSHAEEVVLKKETAVVIASDDEKIRLGLQELLMRDYFRIYTNDDVIGVELGGALKNVLAIGLGVVDGLDMGDNPKAALITRGMYEMAKFAIALGGQFKTLYGLAGLGDLIVTSTSKHSRNRAAGELLAKGYSLDEVKTKVGMVIEGIDTCIAVHDMCQKLDVEMPISDEIYNLINKGHSAQISAGILMNRERKDEFIF